MSLPCAPKQAGSRRAALDSPNFGIGQHMHRTASFANPTPEFDAFLSALVGEDSSGLPLSVVSALARMDLDPWEEAGKLAELPKETASLRLAALLVAIPDASLRNGDRTEIANRLIALLRRGSSAQVKSPMGPIRNADRIRKLPRVYAILFALFIFALLVFHGLASSDGHPAADTTPSTPLR